MKRGNRKVDNEDSVVLSAVNKLATFGVVKALGGITQPIKQLVPIFNTATNSGINNTRKGIALAWSNKDANKAIDDSGMAIANRGLQAQSDLEPIDSRIEKAATSKKGKAINAIDSANKFILQQTLVRPDVFAARASFLAYYIQAMDKKGISSNDIDWSKPLNKEACVLSTPIAKRLPHELAYSSSNTGCNCCVLFTTCSPKYFDKSGVCVSNEGIVDKLLGVSVKYFSRLRIIKIVLYFLYQDSFVTKTYKFVL